VAAWSVRVAGKKKKRKKKEAQGRKKKEAQERCFRVKRVNNFGLLSWAFGLA